MANPYHHAVSSSRQFGGVPEDYQAIHDWFDETKAYLADFRHRALRHHSEGIFLMESIFGPTIDVTIGWEVGGETFKKKDAAAFKARDLFGDPPTIAFEKYVTRVTKKVPTRWVGEQHVKEDMGFIPPVTMWLEQLQAQPWMNRSRKLSRELEQEVEVARQGA